MFLDDKPVNPADHLSQPPAIVRGIDRDPDLQQLRFPKHASDLPPFVSEEWIQRFYESLSRVAAPQEVSEKVVRAALYKLASELADPELSRKYQSDALPLIEVVEVLNYASPRQMHDFLRSLYVLAGQHAEVKSFVLGKLDNVLYFASEEEKASFLKDLSQEQNRRLAGPFVSAVFRSCGDLEEMCRLAYKVGPEELLKGGDRGTRECVALVALGPFMRAVQMPKSLGPDAGASEIDDAIAMLRKGLRERAAFLKEREEFSATIVAHDFDKTVEYELKLIERETAGKTREEKIAAVNFLIPKIALEFRFGVLLTYDTTGHFGKPRKWSEIEVRHMLAALEEMGEGLVITTPLLFEIQKVETLGRWAGQRFPHGVVRIAAEETSPFKPGAPTWFEGLILHELGHSVQLGGNNVSIRKGAPGHMVISIGELRYDMPEFMKISGWSLFTGERYKVTEDGKHVVLDGKEYPLDKPIRHEGREITLRYLYGLLGSFDSGAGFITDYSKTNPLEDWAECFSDYQIHPLDLIEKAPLKFRYFEREFRKYAGNREVMEALRKALE